MSSRILFVTAICVVALVEAARATNVDTVATIAALRTYPGSATTVNVAGYSAPNDGGGGSFVQNGATCSDDKGVIIQETVGLNNCWYRQFSGPVHLLWYGVPDSGTCPSGYVGCDATTTLYNAFIASAAYGDGGVTTDGRSIALLSQCASCSTTTGFLPPAAVIPENQYLTCAAPQGVRRGWSTTSGSDSYWVAPASIVLDLRYTIMRSKNTRLSDCFIRPSWLYQGNTSPPIPPQSVADTVQMVQSFKGTATSCNSPICNMDHMMIAGFDICDNSNGANKAILTDIVEDCLVDEWVHGSGGGGTKLHGINADEVLEGSLGTGVQALQWPIVNVSLSGTDNVVVRVDTGTSSPPVQLQSSGGDTVIIDGLGFSTTAGSPVSANGRWLTTSVSQYMSTQYYDVTLVGASWAGPTFASSSWKAGAPAISVYDTTNVIPGQYVCASSTSAVPFCTPPSGFGFANGTLHAALSITGTGSVQIDGTLAGWPQAGIAQIAAGGVYPSEIVTYTLVDGSHINITTRGVHGTMGVHHNASVAVTPAAPTVVAVEPASDVVLSLCRSTKPGIGLRDICERHAGVGPHAAHSTPHWHSVSRSRLSHVDRQSRRRSKTFRNACRAWNALLHDRPTERPAPE